jgi:lipid-A-disaccharide synthase
MRYYLIAGERSGDLHGGNLIRALQTIDPEAQTRGFGGDTMKAAGMQVTVHYEEMAFMGFWEVIKNLGVIKRRLRTCREDIDEFQPEALILIDYAGFNLKMAAYAKKKNIPVIYYISPKIWAWNQGRGWKIKKLVDKMLCILPFEEEFYQKFGMKVDYVGNPVLDAVKDHEPDREGLPKKTGKMVALLPGSRLQEIQRVLPVMDELVRRHPDWIFLLGTVNNLPASEYSQIQTNGNVHSYDGRTYDLLNHADAAVVTSGTATLETALFKVPQVVVYKTSTFSYAIAKRLIRVPYISLVNLVANKEVVPELIQSDMNIRRVDEEITDMLENKARYDRVQLAYEDIRKTLDIGKASENAASAIVLFLRLGL